MSGHYTVGGTARPAFDSMSKAREAGNYLYEPYYCTMCYKYHLEKEFSSSDVPGFDVATYILTNPVFYSGGC